MSAEMLAALRLSRDAFDELFAHCLSNGVFNQWGQPLYCTTLNRAKHAVENVLMDAPRPTDSVDIAEVRRRLINYRETLRNEPGLTMSHRIMDEQLRKLLTPRVVAELLGEQWP